MTPPHNSDGESAQKGTTCNVVEHDGRTFVEKQWVTGDWVFSGDYEYYVEKHVYHVSPSLGLPVAGLLSFTMPRGSCRSSTSRACNSTRRAAKFGSCHRCCSSTTCSRTSRFLAGRSCTRWTRIVSTSTASTSCSICSRRRDRGPTLTHSTSHSCAIFRTSRTLRPDPPQCPAS